MPERVTSLEPPAEQSNEATLIQRIRDGEHELFYELIRPYERRVYAAFAILRNEADAEDVAQEAVLKALKHIRHFEVRQKLAEALAELGQIYREVFVLRDMQHLSIEETAKALGISTASVKTRLLRARLMLRDLLTPGFGGAWSMTSKLSFAKGTKPW
jgi:DNA-directed RNA polymerase specialized sigma24 family protein